MADRPEQIDDPVLLAAARHVLHDEELIAAFAVDADAADDPARARSLIERCPTCRDLHADLVAVGATIRAADRAEIAGSVRPAPRDFRLTPMDAARLQPGNAFQRGLARARAGAAMFGRPIGAGLATLGVAGLLVGTMGLGQLAPAGAPQSERTSGAGAAAAASAPAGSSLDAYVAQPAASQAPDLANPVPLPTAERQKDQATSVTADMGSGGGAATLVVALSVLLLLAGLALLFIGYRHARAWRRARERT